MNAYEQMREAAKGIANDLTIHLANPSQTIEMNRAEIEALVRDCQQVLSLPRRQCDVGTAEEQAERFKTFCLDHQAPWHGCTNCPVLMSEKCALTWAQMPYTAEEGAGT